MIALESRHGIPCTSRLTAWRTRMPLFSYGVRRKAYTEHTIHPARKIYKNGKSSALFDYFHRLSHHSATRSDSRTLLCRLHLGRSKLPAWIAGRTTLASPRTSNKLNPVPRFSSTMRKPFQLPMAATESIMLCYEHKTRTSAGTTAPVTYHTRFIRILKPSDPSP